jgi:hypothetical protein
MQLGEGDTFLSPCAAKFSARRKNRISGGGGGFPRLRGPQIKSIGELETTSRPETKQNISKLISACVKETAPSTNNLTTLRRPLRRSLVSKLSTVI